jgi:hypothetical protein
MKKKVKRSLFELNNRKRNELDKKRKKIEIQKEILIEGLKESTQKTKIDKINK